MFILQNTIRTTEDTMPYNNCHYVSLGVTYDAHSTTVNTLKAHYIACIYDSSYSKASEQAFASMQGSRALTYVPLYA